MEPLWPPNWSETISRFVFNRDVQGVAREVLYQVRAPQGLTAPQIWTALQPLTEADKAALAGFYLFDLESVLLDHRIGLGERARLRSLRHLLRIEEGDLLRCQRTEVERIVVREIGDILQDDLVDPSEALRQVDLQEALGLSYDEYSQLTASLVAGKIRPWIAESRIGLPPAEFQRRLVALDSLISIPADPVPRSDPNQLPP